MHVNQTYLDVGLYQIGMAPGCMFALVECLPCKNYQHSMDERALGSQYIRMHHHFEESDIQYTLTVDIFRFAGFVLLQDSAGFGLGLRIPDWKAGLEIVCIFGHVPVDHGSFENDGSLEWVSA